MNARSTESERPMTEDQDMALPTARATAATQSNPTVSSKAGIANAVHIRNGRAKLRPHVFGDGKTWCGKKIIGKPESKNGSIETYVVYGSVLQATIDPALGSCAHCRSAFDAAYSSAFPDGPRPVATFRLDNPAEMETAKALFLPEGIKKLLAGSGSQRCTMGVGCDEYGDSHDSAVGNADLPNAPSAPEKE